MKIFVTGGSGFVGGHLIESLAEHEVFALARSERSATVVQALGATPVRGDLHNLEASALEGMDVVIHAAAFVEEWGRPEEYWSANVDGTQHMLDVARASGVRRFVLISTNATVHDRLGQRGVNESASYPSHDGFPYGASKAEAERRVLDAHTADFATVSLRPCFVWGPRDNSVLPSIRRTVEEGGFFWLDSGRALLSTTHVFNVVGAVHHVLERGGEGEAFFVADEGDVTARDFLTDLANAHALELPSRSIPGWLARGVAWSMERVWSLLGRTSAPPLTRMAAMLMSRDMTVQTNKLRGTGWRPNISRDDGLRTLNEEAAGGA